MEEPKKLLQAFYLGCTQVSKSNGIDILNEAIERMLQEKPKSQWQSVNVAVAPSMITISTFEVCVTEQIPVTTTFYNVSDFTVFYLFFIKQASSSYFW